jgi:hypothetical protein
VPKASMTGLRAAVPLSSGAGVGRCCTSSIRSPLVVAPHRFVGEVLMIDVIDVTIVS